MTSGTFCLSELSALIFFQRAVSINYHYRRGDKCEDIRRRHRNYYSVKPPHKREYEHQPDAENYFSYHRQRGRSDRLAHRLQEDERRLVDAGERHHAQIYSEAFHRELGIIRALVRRAEDCYKPDREQLDYERRYRARSRLAYQQAGEQRPYFSAPML